MPRRKYAKPLVTFEHGTKVYAPTTGEPRYRIITRDPAGKRVTTRITTEVAARTHARELDARLAGSIVLPGRAGAPATVGKLIDRYLASLASRSVRYAERQTYLLDRWVRPVLDLPVRGLR